MKRIVSFILMITMCLSLTACAKKEEQPRIKRDDLAMEYLANIGTYFKNRNADAREGQHQAVIDFIVAELKTAGYTDEQIGLEESMSSFKIPIKNIVLTVKGADSSKQILVGGHYDGDGVGDNASGISLILATAVRLAGKVPKYDVKYIFFDFEENGCIGSATFAKSMSQEEADATLFLINIDAIAFGDYCNIYGGKTNLADGTVEDTITYELACDRAESLGYKVYRPEDLDGYFAAHNEGPAVESGTFYTNPWTEANPAPNYDQVSSFYRVFSPSTLPASDHIMFFGKGIPYIYFEATNWFAEGDGGEDAYSGYFETIDKSLGNKGMFMNTKYDTLENLETIFPGRAEEHFKLYAALLESLILDPPENGR